MPVYTPPLRDMQFVLHELLNVSDEFKALPKHAETDADTINAVLEEGGKFAAEVLFRSTFREIPKAVNSTVTRTKSRLPMVSKRRTHSMWPGGGQRSAVTLNSVARACPLW